MEWGSVEGLRGSWGGTCIGRGKGGKGVVDLDLLIWWLGVWEVEGKLVCK